MSTPKFTAIPIERLEAIESGAKAYSGMVAGMETFNGRPIIVMAPSIEDLLAVMHEINPNVIPSRSLCLPASVIADRDIKRKDNDL